MTWRLGRALALGGLLAVGCGGSAASSPTPEPTTYVIITATPGPTHTPAPTPDLQALVESSLAHAQGGDAQAALAVLEQVQALGATSQAQSAWVNAVSALYNRGEYAQAAQLGAAGLAHFPDDANLLFLVGMVALTLGDNQAAIEHLSQAIDLNPQDYRAWHLRGLAHMLAGDTAQAIPDLEQAVALGEGAGVMGNDVAFQAMADLANALAVEDPQAGLVYLAEKRGYYVNYEGVLSGALLAGQGRIWGSADLTTDAALDALNRAIQRNYVEGYYYRALVWEQIGETDKAIRDLETYLEARSVGLVSEWARASLAELQGA